MGKEMRFNNGNKKGKTMIEHSIKTLGCGRSILVDQNGEIISGHDVYEAAIKLGKKIITIETDGDVLVVVKRTDVVASETKGLELSLVDNLSSEKNLNWDADKLISTMQQNMAFDPRKWGGHSCLVKELDLNKFFEDDIQSKQQTEEEFKQYTQLSLFDIE